jgi:hypothetical protein
MAVVAETTTHQIKSAEDLCITLFTQHARSSHSIDSSVEHIVSSGDVKQLKDLAVMIFQTCDIHGGKGEKKIFQLLMTSLARAKPAFAQALVSLVPEYGSWKDLWQLMLIPGEQGEQGQQRHQEQQMQSLQNTIDDLVKEQFAMDQESEWPSLLAKFLPREKSNHDLLARHFATLLFPLTHPKDRMRTYRKVCSFLNKKIVINNVKPSGKVWFMINNDRIPFNKHRDNGLTVQENIRALLDHEHYDMVRAVVDDVLREEADRL